VKKLTPNNQFELRKIDGESVHLSGEGEAIIPKNVLPKGAKVGDKFILNILEPESEAEKGQATAREILNEILKPKE
jgi:hypothetical protein